MREQTPLSGVRSDDIDPEKQDILKDMLAKLLA